MSNTGWAAVVIAIIVILGLGWWFLGAQPMSPATNTNTTVNTGNSNGTGGAGDSTGVGVGADADVGIGDASTQNRATVRYTASGFSPATLTVPVGTAVTFINDTSAAMWVGADEHPTHTEFDGTSRTTHCSGSYTGATPFDQCQNGSTYTFVFNKAGTFGYHNHSGAQHEGTITVQ